MGEHVNNAKFFMDNAWLGPQKHYVLSYDDAYRAAITVVKNNQDYSPYALMRFVRRMNDIILSTSPTTILVNAYGLTGGNQ